MGNYPALGEVLAMNAQALFDHIAQHLIEQDSRCQELDRNGDAQCLYRDASGRACAIGAIIPDEFYDTQLEGRSLGDLIVFLKYEGPGSAYLLAQQLERHFALLARLQSIHDHSAPCHWPEELQRHARCHQLDTTSLQKALTKRWQQRTRGEPAVPRFTALPKALMSGADVEYAGVCG